ncbi:hypothetical protein B0H16DRAFT_1749295 [Mycena metata]|uniref:Uncharacterized protein n=1 Tax=Mycena metata TaxID=1033252 RepID=A0AAD7DV04_9AGAR|nr:hypothetical protein B0H16DRAFT_1749295 [Mycena metata]
MPAPFDYAYHHLSANPNSNPNASFLEISTTAPPPFNASQANLAGSHTLTHLLTYSIYTRIPAFPAARSHRQRQRKSNKAKGAYLHVGFSSPMNAACITRRGFRALQCAGSAFAPPSASLSLPHPVLSLARARPTLPLSTPIRLSPSHRQYRVYVAPAAAAHGLLRWRNAQRSWTPVSSSPSPSPSSPPFPTPARARALPHRARTRACAAA